MGCTGVLQLDPTQGRVRVQLPRARVGFGCHNQWIVQTLTLKNAEFSSFFFTEYIIVCLYVPYWRRYNSLWRYRPKGFPNSQISYGWVRVQLCRMKFGCEKSYPCRTLGRIQSTFTRVKNSTTLMLIDYPKVIDYFTCFLFILVTISSTRLFKAVLSRTHSSYTLNDIIEKCAYFEHPNGKYYFMRFPNLVHSL